MIFCISLCSFPTISVHTNQLDPCLTANILFLKDIFVFANSLCLYCLMVLIKPSNSNVLHDIKVVNWIFLMLLCLTCYQTFPIYWIILFSVRRFGSLNHDVYFCEMHLYLFSSVMLCNLNKLDNQDYNIQKYFGYHSITC